MHRGNQYLASLFVSAALLAPMGAFAFASPQDDHERHEREEHRVYDPYRKDYHNWDQRENEAYRHWLEERHEAYVDYERLKHKEQRAYWNWRHNHEEHEEHEHMEHQ
jgi:uncharacterized protein YecT (DUF1311 family)